MRAIRISAVPQEDQQQNMLRIAQPQQAASESPIYQPGATARQGKLSAATMFHVQRIYGNSVAQRMLANHTSARGCSCLACKPLIRPSASVQASPAVQRCGGKAGCGCASCSGQQEEEQAGQSVQRWLWDDDSDSDGTNSGDSSSSQSDSDSSGSWFNSSDSEPASSNEPASSSDSDGGSSSWWPFGGDSESEDSEDSNQTESDPDEDAGEVSYGLPGDSRTRPAVTHYGKLGVYDAEGYCKWDNIESDANNDKIVTTTLPNGKIKATGTTVMTFTSTADYTLPSVPSTITNDCEKQKYQKAIDTTLRAHEEQHKAGFLTYNGTASAAVNVTADNETALLAAVTAATLDPTTDARYNAAKKKSSDVDPPGGFKFTPDLSGC